MTQYLPPNLLAFFAPRDPLPFLPAAAKLPHEKKTKGIAGVGQYLNLFEDPKDTPPPMKIETREERADRKKREKLEKAAYIKEQGIALWDPNNNPNATSAPYKTLFIARVSADTTEAKLKKEFEAFGKVAKVSMIYDKITGKHKGYAFVEYEKEEDMHSAYKLGDGKKIEGRRVLVDVERGRTVKGWLPRRLGGGLSDSKPRGPAKDEREESRNFAPRERFDRRDRDRSRRSRSRERVDRVDRSGGDRRRRSKSRERERERSDRDRGGRSRDRSTKDRHESSKPSRSRARSRSRDRHGVTSSFGNSGDYDSRSEAKMSSRGGYGDNGDGGYSSSRKHRGGSRERSDKKRGHRSRSRSRSPTDRKKSRSGAYDSNGNGAPEKTERLPKYVNYESDGELHGEIEEGEDRSYEAEYRRPYGGSNNGGGGHDGGDYQAGYPPVGFIKEEVED